MTVVARSVGAECFETSDGGSIALYLGSVWSGSDGTRGQEIGLALRKPSGQIVMRANTTAKTVHIRTVGSHVLDAATYQVFESYSSEMRQMGGAASKTDGLIAIDCADGLSADRLYLLIPIAR